METITTKDISHNHSRISRLKELLALGPKKPFEIAKELGVSNNIASALLSSIRNDIERLEDGSYIRFNGSYIPDNSKPVDWNNVEEFLDTRYLLGDGLFTTKELSILLGRTAPGTSRSLTLLKKPTARTKSNYYIVSEGTQWRILEKTQSNALDLNKIKELVLSYRNDKQTWPSVSKERAYGSLSWFDIDSCLKSGKYSCKSLEILVTCLKQENRAIFLAEARVQIMKYFEHWTNMSLKQKMIILQSIDGAQDFSIDVNCLISGKFPFEAFEEFVTGGEVPEIDQNAESEYITPKDVHAATVAIAATTNNPDVLEKLELEEHSLLLSKFFDNTESNDAELFEVLGIRFLA